MTEITLAQKIAHYITLRDHKKAADAEFKKSMERVNAAMVKLEAELLKTLEETGLDSLAEKGVGTAFAKTHTSMTTEDRDAFLKWALQNRELEAMDIRPNKTIIREKMEKGEVIPGVKITQTRVVNVRADRKGKTNG